MATSKCGHCDCTSFETKEASVKGANFKLFFVQCASCGVPVAVLEAGNSTQGFLDMEKEIRLLKEQIARLR
jgi:predicted nucleic-acid-binding Zn-ribbon protein